ncbi:hypothetical protein V8B97DRAFT_1876750 [Scleroderma yunnanense]
MRLINVKAFIEREWKMRLGWPVNHRTKVLEFRDDDSTDYAILSHRWTDQEVNYEEMVELAKIDADEGDEIRQRDGYRKVLDSCEQAKKDRYEWLWVDTCCIDKRSSAELSEAINSMYRWYQNSTVCYAYLHDVPGLSFPTRNDDERYPNSNGWPEWFLRGWTLQEMIAPSNVQFFNKDWKHISDKRSLAGTLSHITRVPEHILTDGLSSNRPCVAQIMSWAAKRVTTRVEDRAYSLLGLLDVNMPMLYGEGKKAFHRLQLEIIRMSNDQSIFAWASRTGAKPRTGSILADDPSFFRDCYEMELMDPDEFIDALKYRIPEALHSTEADPFGTFPITNRGIQIWMLICPMDGSDFVFEASLPCRSYPLSRPVRITLALWKSNYHRYVSLDSFPTKRTLQLRQVYLRYQHTLDRDATFEIDDSAITKNGFTYCGAYPSTLRGNTFMLTSTDPLCIKVYSDTQANCRFAVGFGQCFGQDWIHCVSEKPSNEHSLENYSRFEYDKMMARGLEHAQSMPEMYAQGGHYGRVWVRHTCLASSTWTVRTSCIVWKSSRNRGVRIDVFRHPCSVPDKWIGFNVEGTDDPNRDMRGLMIPLSPRTCTFRSSYTLLVDGVSMKFWRAPNEIKLGDYGYLTDSEEFCCEGNIFTALRSLAFQSDATSNQHKIEQEDGYNTDGNHIEVHDSERFGVSVTLYKPLGLSLQSNHDFNLLLASLSTQLVNRYLIETVISSERTWVSRDFFAPSTFDPTTPLCTISKPFVWHRDEGVGAASVEQSDDEL